MFINFKRDQDKIKYIVIFIFTITCFFLLSVAYKNDDKIKGSKVVNIFSKHQDFPKVKEFLIKKIQSPFINVDYEIKKGDSIQKILQKFKINNQEIQDVIIQYKKYGNTNKLLVGNKIEIIVEKNISKKSNSILKFSVPVTKSTNIEISKNEEGNIESKKIITKLYKKKVIVENTIKNNLYKSAVEANIAPNTIIEFARIFGFEIDFQRDIRKNDTFQILHETFVDENGEWYSNGKII